MIVNEVGSIGVRCVNRVIEIEDVVIIDINRNIIIVINDVNEFLGIKVSNVDWDLAVDGFVGGNAATMINKLR